MHEHNIYIYISCRESFKKRLNHGVWVDPSLPVEEMMRIILTMLASSLYAGNTGWWITQFDTPVPYDFLSDQTSLEDLHSMAMLIEHHGDVAAKLLAYFDGDIVETEDAMENRYCGQYDSEIAFTKQRLGEAGYILTGIEFAIDYGAIWRLWQRDRFFSLPAKSGGVYILSKQYEQ